MLNTSSYTCTWKLSGVDTDWFNASNWSNCSNGRSGYPDQNDYAIVPSGATFNPVISQNAALSGFAAGAGGGTITVNSGVKLFIPNSTNSFLSSVAFQGSTNTCSTCYVQVDAFVISNNATLSLKSDITALHMNGARVIVGSSTSAGHLKAIPGSANQTQWPILSAYYYYYMGMDVLGPSAANRSSIEIDGLKINNMIMTSGQGPFINLINNYRVYSLRNLTMQTSGNSALDSNYISVRNCGNSVFDRLSWLNIDFMSSIGLGKNIDIQGCSSLGAGAISVSQLSGGTNAGYGAGNATDPNGILAWQ